MSNPPVGSPVNLEPSVLATWEREIAEAARYFNAAKAPATLRAYRSDWRVWYRWCGERDLDPLAAEGKAVAVFAAAQASDGRRPSTILRRLAAIRYHYLQANMPSPTDEQIVGDVLAGIRRTHSVRPNKKRPITVSMLRDMVDAIPLTPRGQRDKALLLLGFAGAFRRSEVANLEVRHLEWVAEGVKIHLDSSKGNQEGQAEVVPVLKGTDLCPVQALKAWMISADLIEGPIFRKISKSGRLGPLAVNDRFVAKLVKWYLFCAGYEHEQFSAHSLRSGFLTAAAANKASLFSLQRVSRHRRVETLMGYLDQAEAFVDHAAEGLL